MSRVAPPPIQNPAPAPLDDIVAPGRDERSQADDASSVDFAEALQQAGQVTPADAQDKTADTDPKTPLSFCGAPQAAPLAPPPQARAASERDAVKPRQADPLALSPAMRPSIAWQAILPQGAAVPAQASSDGPGLAADAAGAAQAKLAAPLGAVAGKALAAQLAESSLPQEAAAAPLPSLMPLAAHAAEPGKPAESVSLALPAAQPESWGGKLQAALGERLQVLSSQNQDRATIRLDPPALGSLEIAIRHQAGVLTVELTASHGEVVRQLQSIGDALRQDLGSRQYTQVAVDVKEGMPSGHGQGGRHGREPQAREEPGRALSREGWRAAGGFELEQG
ncbi:flagellar hook-length control protein FliK [Chromobacterium paludis]|nr:flagellar hook-length control protein FliK [Chromobacterium paludis]